MMLSACNSDQTDEQSATAAPVDESLTALDCGSQGDGEGCARLLGRDYFSAGETTDFVIEFTVGSSGIPVGGGIALGIHHAAGWSTSLNERARGFVQVKSERPERLSLVKHRSVPFGMFGVMRSEKNSNQIFHQLIIATVVDAPLEPGERVQFYFGANKYGIKVQPYVDPDHQFRVTTDVDADGLFTAIAESPVFPIRPAPASSLTAVLRSQVVAGETVPIQVRVEDAYFNVATAYSGSVDIRDEQGSLVVEALKIEGGIAETQVTLNTLGPHRLRLQTRGDGLTGRSNPLRVFDAEPAVRVFWADLHGHTGISDGLGANAYEYFKFGRDIAKLDINALTDHGQPDWPANVRAVQDFYEPGHYVTLLAQEAGIGPDHMNLYYRRDNMPHLSYWYTNYGDQLEGARKQFNSTEINAMTAPHHFAYDRGARGNPDYPFDIWDDRIMRFVEVYSSHGTSEFPGNPRPLRNASSEDKKYMQHALAKGLKFGVIAASDNHDSHPGRSIWGPYPGGLAGIWSTELTRESVWQALYSYSTYGTSMDRIYLDFRINGQLMGSTLPNPASVEIAVDVIGKTDQITVDLIRDNATLASFESDSGVVEIRMEDETAGDEHFYYVRVTQDNGERAWSSPIWVTAD